MNLLQLQGLAEQGKLHGLFEDLPPEIYHQSPGLSQSQVKRLEVTPAHLQAYLRKERKKEITGTLTHMRTFEPDRFDRIVVPIPGHRGSTSVKEAIKQAEADGKFVCSPADYEQVCRMVEAVREHPEAKLYIEGGLSEASAYWTDEEFGEPLRCRFDKIHPEAGIVVDLKYFSPLTIKAVQGQIYREKYHWQGGWYLDGASAVLKRQIGTFCNIFVEEVDPFGVRVGFLSEADLELARAEYRPLIAKYQKCRKENHWPCYPEEPVNFGLSHYAWETKE